MLSELEHPTGDKEGHSPMIYNMTIINELEDNECIELIVPECLEHEIHPGDESTNDGETTSVKKKGKRPMCGKNLHVFVSPDFCHLDSLPFSTYFPCNINFTSIMTSSIVKLLLDQ
jgi:hypothetical protein